MSVTPDEEYAEETTLPEKRLKRVVSKKLMDTLEDSARRQVAFSRTGRAEEIEELRKDLNAGPVRGKFHVSTETAKLANGQVKLKFAATLLVADAQPAPGPQAPPEPTAQDDQPAKTAKK